MIAPPVPIVGLQRRPEFFVAQERRRQLGGGVYPQLVEGRQKSGQVGRRLNQTAELPAPIRSEKLSG